MVRDVDEDDRSLSLGEEINQTLREELGSENTTSSPKTVSWPIYTKKRSGELSEQDEPPYKAVIFDVASRRGTVGGGELSRGNATNASEGVPQSFVTSGGFSTLEGIADERVVGARKDDEGEGIVRNPLVDELFGQEAVPKERTKYYSSQLAKILLKDCFKLNPPTHLDASHPTTSLNADQMIHFPRVVGLKVSLASYSMHEDLLLKARGGSGA